MTHHVDVRAVTVVAVLAIACASSQPAAAPQPAKPSATAAMDTEYVRMAVAAAGQVRTVVPDRVIGVYQTGDTARLTGRLEASVIQAYSFVAIKSRDAQLVCAQVPAQRTKLTAVQKSPSCAFDLAEVLVQFNAIQIVRDTGYIGGMMAEVPRGTSRVRTTAFCLLAAYHGGGWDGVSYATVDVPQNCAADRKH